MTRRAVKFKRLCGCPASLVLFGKSKAHVDKMLADLKNSVCSYHRAYKKTNPKWTPRSVGDPTVAES